MGTRVLRLTVAGGILLASAHVASAQIRVTLKNAFNPPANGVPCVAEMSPSDKNKHFDADTMVTWTIDGSMCSAYDPAALRVKFAKKSRLIKHWDNRGKCMATANAGECTISGKISDRMAEAPSHSRHPYAILFNGDATGDPEIDIDNGGGSPTPPGTGPTR
jgi:hypothetical protein